MAVNPMLYLLFGVVVGVAGALVLVGAVLWVRSPAQEAGEGGEQPKPEPPARWAHQQSTPATVSPLADDKVIQVWPDYDGGWVVQVSGRTFRHIDEVVDPLLAERIAGMLTGLNQFAQRGGKRQPEVTPHLQESVVSAPPQPVGLEAIFEPPPVVEPPADQKPPQPETRASLPGSALLSGAASSSLPAPTASVAPPPPPSEESFLRSLQTPPSSAPASQPARGLGLFSFGGRQRAGKDGSPGSQAIQPESPDALGIAGQIEKVLQQQLQGRPDMAGREIHVKSAPDGSLRVEVDSRIYPGIDSVPDPAVQAVLQTAVKTWEAHA